MKRKIYQNLLNWKLSDDRKPLILQGARQVGKTYIVNIFGDNEYSNVVYCNFEKEELLATIFSDLDPKTIIAKLANYKRKEIIPGATLILFDEVQSCPQALTSLKYFNETANDYHIIALGSLLGVSVHRENFSFPVGKVEFLNMYPMDFEEYLMAKDEDFLISQIRESFISNKPLDELFHKKAINIYKEYLLVGGMPEVVEEYIKTGNYNLTRNKQDEILVAYRNDMGKYNKESEIPKTQIVYKNISTQLSKENKKFQYKLLKKGGRSSEFESAIEWLCLAGIANQLYRLEQIKLPLNAYKSLTDFKFFMNDVGLCCASQSIHFDDIYFDNELINDFKGGLTENYINNQLIINGLNLYYWTSGNQAEVDFITRIESDIIPIEVKSSDNTKSKSLSIYKEKYTPKYSIRLSTKNFGLENEIKSVPLYAAFCIK
ncbi:MAG: ATP-binding protein [Clostridia bacterium]|nr:ATP-binding protein [Clostridia bacterium]